MTDEEILYGLRNPPVMSMALSKDDLYGMMRERMQVAADCIEQLVAQLKMILEREAETQARHEAREDAIREAALREAAEMCDRYPYVEGVKNAILALIGETK